jgi:tyrosyl-DNA phosphodiesterase 2
MSPLRSVTFTEGGKMLLAKTKCSNGKELVIATSHLKSTRNSTTSTNDWNKRKSQAKEAIEKLDPYPNIILGGDMNWRNRDDFLPLKSGWIDAWQHIKPQEPGYTFDTESNPYLINHKISPERLDRFLCKLTNFELVDIEMIGNKEIPVVVPCELGNFRKQSVIISDHYGLILTVRVI